jgi:LPS-assembly protein
LQGSGLKTRAKLIPLLLGCMSGALWAQSASDGAAEPKANLKAPGETRVSAIRIHGTHALDMVAEGEVELQRDTVTLTADRITYREPADEVVAEGNVRLRQGDTAEMSGSSARMVIGERTGEFLEPKYSMTRTRAATEEGAPPKQVSGSGHADALRLEGENHYRALSATWSTCEAPDPDWYVKAGDLELDYDREIGTARDSSLVFKGVPLFWLPWAEFPLVGQRHSGVLAPTMEHSTDTGFGLTVPYYWNIAPNYDLTVNPRFMSERGVQMGGEARYLGATYSGTIKGEYLPKDRITNEDRTLISLEHKQWITSKLYGSLNFNRVSDDEYFEDLSSQVSMTSKVNLLREAHLVYAGADWWSASALAQSYQTLSPDPANPNVEPYRRLPQITLNATRLGEFRNRLGGGLDFKWQSEYTRFTHPDKDALHPDGNRLVAYPQVSLPLQSTGAYFTPKIGVHYTHYDLDRKHHLTYVNHDGLTLKARENIDRRIPIFTIDSGLTFERDTHLFGRDYTQTLEPRLYYVKASYRRQDDIPLFDTTRFDFGFAQLFSENIYSGSDRIVDANQLTAAVTTRLIEPGTGIERLRLLIGQRYYFDDQFVTLYNTDEPRTSWRADVLAGLSTRVGRNATFETLWQYNQDTRHTERYTATLRYNPSHARAINLGYRFSRDILRDVDVSGQWPLWGNWYGVGRVTYSLMDARLTEAIAGLEYNGGCWVLRIGGHHYSTELDKYKKTYFVQLELNDFANVGTGGNVVNMIKRSVPGYGKINESGSGAAYND